MINTIIIAIFTNATSNYIKLHETVNPWSDILFLHPSMLNHAIADPSDCIADLATLEDIICTQELIDQFEADYGLQLNKEERKALVEIGCMEDYDDFVEEAKNKLIENLLSEHPELTLSALEKTFIENNLWIYHYIDKYYGSEFRFSQIGRPDIGPIGNLIRTQLHFAFDKDCFERYWLGLGDWHKPQNKAEPITSLIMQNTTNWSAGYDIIGIDELGRELRQYLFDAYNTDYALSFGKLQINILQWGSTGIENLLFHSLYDSYDFNPTTSVGMTINGLAIVSAPILTTLGFDTQRTFSNEWKTRAVSFASIFSSSKNFQIYYP